MKAIRLVNAAGWVTAYAAGLCLAVSMAMLLLMTIGALSDDWIPESGSVLIAGCVACACGLTLGEIYGWLYRRGKK